MTPRLIVFDFDGTIADTPQTVFAIVNRLAEEFNYPALSAAQILTLQGLSSREIVRQADVSMLKLPFLLRRGKQEIKRGISSIQPIFWMEEAPQELKAQSYRLG
ncbi:MAG: HAD hydrolase-like protein, partial [Jaaginema sp. PMC 1079.18]|nr:HAD hydrolase-like protein [Jaaginema sp. PMC 1079.18]